MRDPLNRPTVLTGANAEFLEHLYEQYLERPNSVDPQWQDFFSQLQKSPSNGSTAAVPAAPSMPSIGETLAAKIALIEPIAGGDGKILTKQSAVFQLINHYRLFGHTQAKLDPLGTRHTPQAPDLTLQFFGLTEEDLDQVFSTGTLVAPPALPLRDIRDHVAQTYCGHVGIEYMHVRNYAQRRWLQEAMESTRNQPKFDAETRRYVLTKLTESELLEKFLHTKFVGQKRFSLEGGESLIVMMEGLVEEAAELGAEEVVIGMPHRGRINTLINIMGKQPEQLFAEFRDSYEVDELTGSGDVKYHKGYSSDRVTRGGKKIHLSMSFNPSHLEAVNPVVVGNVRAKQERRGDQHRTRIVPVLMHGDAAFAGQGLVAETLNLSQLEGYKTGGTIHIIVNNQIGFTTSPRHSRSFLYPSDVCKMLSVPVLHVNGDDPEAVLHVIKLAVGFRQFFHTDIVIDLFCYRRHGHNETDEPSFTQPLMYKRIKDHASTLEIYSKALVEQGAFSQDEVAAITAGYRKHLDGALRTSVSDNVKPGADTLGGVWQGLERGLVPKDIDIQEVTLPVLQRIGEHLARVPADFTPHPRLLKLLQTRGDMVHDKAPIDWGMGELLAYGSLVSEGFHVRLSGQDSGRGTFSHRHARMEDQNTGQSYFPLRHLPGAQGVFTVIDSPLSEAAVMGFDFGYTLADPFCLTLWEAQFGDFANGAQVIVDQFLAASEEKWLRMSGLVLLLPHGYEGQGPEHSSARLERYLQLCANNNLQVCNATTPAQFFHLMRRQMHRNFRKPLILMTPKSLLRHPMAVSSTADLIKGRFRKVLYEKDALPANGISRVVFCSGKLFYELYQERNKRKLSHIAVLRLEQLYPFPDDPQDVDDNIQAILKKYPNVKDVVWAQEEPKNMGAWSFLEPRFRDVLPPKLSVRYIGRKDAASPAAGSHRVHHDEQERIVDAALS
jgi:2-oxoglutarate dehydrogenase E1 component